MSTESNIEIVRRHIEEAVNQQKVDVVDELYDPDVVYHDPFTPGGRGQGTKPMKDFMVATTNAFPDFHFDVEDIFGSGDLVVWRGRATGTHKGDFPGLPASGKPIDLPMTQFFRITEGKVRELWVFTDSMLMLMQTGAMPAPQGAPAS